MGDGEKHRAQISTGHGYNNDTNRDMHVHSHPPYCLLVPPIPLPYLSHTSPMSGTKSSKPRRKARGKRSNATRTALALPNPMRGVILVYQPCAPRLPLPHQQPRLHHRGRRRGELGIKSTGVNGEHLRVTNHRLLPFRVTMCIFFCHPSSLVIQPPKPCEPPLLC